jgi:hypothetical protein
VSDLLSVTATPRALRIGGEEHRLSPLTVDDFGELQAWVDSQFPDPFEVANAVIARGDYTVPQQQFFYRLAMEQSTRGKRLIGSSPEADDMVRSLEGTIQLLWISVRKAEPGFTPDDAVRLRKKMSFGDIARVFQVTNADMVLSDPKASPPAGGTAPKASRRRGSTGGASRTT